MRQLISTVALLSALGLGACATTAGDAPDTSAASSTPAASAPAAAATPAPNTQAFSRVVDLGQGVSMLMGQGGNLGLSVGEDGVFMIDDQYATNAIANLTKIEELAKGKPKYLVNTHWHFDHAGGNEVFAKAGATVFASDAVRKRLTAEVKSVNRQGVASEPAPREAWPVVTFVDGVDFHLNGQTIRAIRTPLPAHTDGDVFVYFVEADVLHMGDTYMKDRYPFVDTGSGGTQAGFIAAIRKALEIARPTTKVIPGHGELATKADLQAALAMHEGARAAVQAQIDAGRTLEQTIAAKPLAQWTPRFGPAGGFITDDAYVTVIYNELRK